MEASLAGTTLYDMHCHLDFFAHPAEAARELETLRVCALSATVTPAGYARAARKLAQARNARVGVGLHPWWLADGTCGEHDVAEAAALARDTRVVAEVGLDFARGRDACAEMQQDALGSVLAACEGGGHVLSLHAVRSAGALLDMLEAHGTVANNIALLHWFSGTGPELARAVRMGCHVSVGPRMLQTKRGREWARQVPLPQLMLETDSPGSAEEGATLRARAIRESLEKALTQLAEIRGVEPPELAEALGRTSRIALFG